MSISKYWKVLVSAQDTKAVETLLDLAKKSGGEFYRHPLDDIIDSKSGLRACFYICALTDVSAQRLYSEVKTRVVTASMQPGIRHTRDRF